MHTFPARPSRRRLALALAIAWGCGVTLLVARLGRECPVAGSPLAGAEARGWSLRYVLAASAEDGAEMLRYLAARGPRPDFAETVELAGPPAARRQLGQAGWSVAAGDSAGPARLEILDPSRRIAWSGLLPAADLRTPGARLLDRELLARVIRGQSVPRIAPVGCAP